MSKKYVPSGYQIINLLSLAFETGDVVEYGKNEEVDILIDLYRRNELSKKPILLAVKPIDGDKREGFVTIKNDNTIIMYGTYYIIVSSDSVQFLHDLGKKGSN